MGSNPSGARSYTRSRLVSVARHVWVACAGLFFVLGWYMRLVSIDLETRPIARGEDQAPYPVVVSIHTDTEHYLTFPWGDWSWVDDPDTYLLGANLPFDLSVLIRRCPQARPHILRAIREMRVLDLQQAENLTEISTKGFVQRVALAYLAKKYLGIQLEKDHWRTDYDKLEEVPLEFWPEGAKDYALLDSWTARKVFDEICKVNPDCLGVLAHLTAADWALHEAEINGVHSHPERSRRLVARVNARLELATKTLRESGILRSEGKDAGTKDTTKAKKLMALVHPEGPKTETGGISLTAEATQEAADLIKLKREHGELVPDELISGARYLQAYSEYVSADKLRATAQALLHGFDIPLQTRFNACMKTYRTSSSMPDGITAVGMQMQNPPRVSGLRECFIPAEDEVFIGADYGQAELFSLAQLCRVLFGYSVLGDVLNSGEDVHIWFASKVLGCTYAEAKAHPKIKHYRQLGKVANFGLPGGLGAASLVNYAWANYGVLLTEDEARALIATWRAAFPCAVQYLDWINGRLRNSTKGFWHKGKWVKTFDYKHPITGFTRGNVGYTDGANTGFQSLTAYYGKTACVRVVLACYDPESPLYGFKLWSFVHDELLLRGPKDRSAGAAIELKKIMEAACLEVIPNYPITADPWCASVWSKHIPDKMDVSKPWIFEDAVLGWVREKKIDKLRDVGMEHLLCDNA
jgi:hypothetical protein